MNSENSVSLPEEVHSLLSSSPPFVTKDSLKVLSQLLDPVVNTPSRSADSTQTNGNVWQSLNDFVAPTSVSSNSFDLLKFLEDNLGSEDIKALSTSIQVALASSTLANSSSFSSNIEFLTSANSLKASTNKFEVVDDNSICLSAPLNPTSADQVTLTPHQINLVNQKSTTSAPKSGTGEGKWWKFGGNGSEEIEGNEYLAGDGGKIKLVAKKVFFPPVDKVSVKVCWWGYEIFLPHSSMVSLGNNVEKALSTLSTTISFLLTHIPTSLLTLPAIPFILSLLPILSTIDGFLSFYWKQIKADDLGSGTILSACWLLPVALIPRTLDLKEWGEGLDGTPLPVESSPPTSNTTPAVPNSPPISTTPASTPTVSIPTSNSQTIAGTEPPLEFSGSRETREAKQASESKKAGLQAQMNKVINLLRSRK